MKSKNIILRGIQGLSILAIVTILGLGFIMPVSIAQGFIIHPLLLLVLIGSITFVESKIDYEQNIAELHQLPAVKHRFQPLCHKAA